MTIHINIEAASAEQALEEMERLLQGRSSQTLSHGGPQHTGKPVGVTNESPSPSPPASAPSESGSEDEAPVSRTAKKKASKKKASKKKTAKKTEPAEPEGGEAEVSLDDVMAMGKKVHATFGMNTIRDLIESHGGENLSSIPPENRDAFMAACQDTLDNNDATA